MVTRNGKGIAKPEMIWRWIGNTEMTDELNGIGCEEKKNVKLLKSKEFMRDFFIAIKIKCLILTRLRSFFLSILIFN